MAAGERNSNGFLPVFKRCSDRVLRKGADYLRTESIQYLSENQENRISFTCPEGVILHNETTGEEKAGIVSVRAGESFYFSAPLRISVRSRRNLEIRKITGGKRRKMGSRGVAVQRRCSDIRIWLL